MKTLLLVLMLCTSSLLADDKTHTLATDGKVAVQWHFHDEYRVWLSVNSYSADDWVKDGYNPSFTYVRCQYKPVVRKQKDGQWVITFSSEIADVGDGIP